MALGDNYATLAELKSRIGISDTNDDTKLNSALSSASRGIEKICLRQFNDAGVTSTRRYRTRFAGYVDVDDFNTTTGLIIAVDNSDNGTFATTWTTSYYELDPIDGVVDGETGWPYSRIIGIGGWEFPVYNERTQVSVTARWGWTAVPAPIKEAVLLVAEETFKLKDAPFGVAGYGEFGAVRIRQNPMAMNMITPYRRDPVLVG